MRILLFILFPIFVFSQDFQDLTTKLDSNLGGWSIGNACGKDFRLNGVYKKDLDMKGENFEILNSHFIIEGDVLNPGTIVYLCDNSILEIKGGVLSTPDQKKEAFQIYPNPAINEINIKGIDIEILELYDMYGRRLKNYQTVGRLHRIMIDDLVPGIYFLKINNSSTHKIIKQ